MPLNERSAELALDSCSWTGVRRMCRSKTSSYSRLLKLLRMKECDAVCSVYGAICCGASTAWLIGDTEYCHRAVHISHLPLQRTEASRRTRASGSDTDRLGGVLFIILWMVSVLSLARLPHCGLVERKRGAAPGSVMLVQRQGLSKNELGLRT